MRGLEQQQEQEDHPTGLKKYYPLKWRQHHPEEAKEREFFHSLLIIINFEQVSLTIKWVLGNHNGCLKAKISVYESTADPDKWLSYT